MADGYDAVRTARRARRAAAGHQAPSTWPPRSCGRRDRNGLDTSYVDDVVFGTVGPVKEQGNLTRVGLYSGYDQSVPGMRSTGSAPGPAATTGGGLVMSARPAWRPGAARA